MTGEEIHAKLLEFLSKAFSRKENRAAVRVDLLHSQPNTRDTELRRWVRAEEPETFDSLVNVENLINKIIEIAEGHADSYGYGSHRFVVRVTEHMGGKQLESFRIKPSFDGNDDSSMAMTVGGLNGSGGGGGAGAEAALAALLTNNGQFMRINQQMFDSAFRTLATLTENTRDENIELKMDNARLRKALEEAESNKDAREFQYAMAAEKNARVGKTTEKLLQLGTVIAAKITGTSAELGAPDGLQMLLMEFGKSLRPQQLQALAQVLDQGQLAQFFAIMEMLSSKAQAQQGAPRAKPAGAGGGGSPPPPTA